MSTQTPILTRLRQWRDAYGGIAAASVLGFVCGLMLATQSARLQGYLLERVMEWRLAALELHPPETIPAGHIPVEKEPAPEEPEFVPEQLPIVPSVSGPPLHIPVKKPVIQPTKIHPAATDPAPTPMVPESPKGNKENMREEVRPIPLVPQSPKGEEGSPDPSLKPAPPAPVEPSPAEPSDDGFPAFGRALYPISTVPNWGSMHAAAEWNRPYGELAPEEFVAVPGYDMAKLTTPFQSLLNPRNEGEITRKLFYSTHFFGAYDVDAGEFTAAHPGIDLKLALGTPLGAIAGGRVHTVINSGPLGLHVVIEHRIGGAVYYSIYGHLAVAGVREGQDVTPGQFIGTVGMTGSTTGAHVHLQVDVGHGETVHEPYAPKSVPSAAEAAKWVVNPITFIAKYSHGG